MKIFCILSNYPKHDGEAIEVVSDEIVKIMSDRGNQVIVQVILRTEPQKDDFRIHQKVSDFFSDRSVKLLPTIHLKGREHRVQKWFKKVQNYLSLLPFKTNPYSSIFFPSLKQAETVERRVRSCNPDIIIGIWSWESLAAVSGIKNLPVFMYYGNPDHKPQRAMLKFPELFDLSPMNLKNKVKIRCLKWLNRELERQHVKMMNNTQVTANNSIVDAEYYAANGHQKSIYLQNMWPESDCELGFNIDLPKRPLRIAGSVGNLGATGNTFGLNFLGEKLLSPLKERVPEGELEINVYGGGKPTAHVGKKIQSSPIFCRGWVDDLNTEIIGSHVFLVLTNVDGFIVGNTRILLAWSLGACVVAHTNSSLSMPEIKNDQNILMGESAEEIADIIVAVADNPDLRKRIGRGGLNTYNQFYKSKIVVPKMLNEMQRCINEFHYK